MGEENSGVNETGAHHSTEANNSGRAKADLEPSVAFPKWIFALTMTYLIVLMTLFICYETSPTLQHDLPTTFGGLPAGVVWFGAMGAVVASLRGIFIYNGRWKESFNYRYVGRPLFGAVTGSIGALLYWVLLFFGSKSPPTIDTKTFFAVAFVFGFADAAFLQTMKDVTDIVIRSGKKPSTPT